MQHALVTGGAGFIGSHLCEQLLQQGYQLTILDDLSTGRFQNIAHLESDANVRVVIDSVIHEDMVKQLVADCDCVYHLASAVGVQLIMDQPVKTIENIFVGTEIVLRHCARLRKPVLVTSTSEVYGKGIAVPFHEDDDVVTGATSKHRWAYACAKSLDEFLCLAHWKQSRMPVSVVRLFNTVGPRQTGQYGMVIPRFVQAALEGAPLTVYGGGIQSRCFAHVADIVQGLVKMLETPSAHGQVVNLGNDEEVTIMELAQRVIAATESTSEIQHLSYEEVYGAGFEDMERRVPALGRARELVGYQATCTLDDILRDVIAEQRAAM
ncbi:MAG TPA: nucleoside-diphosphate sugar epimerase [Planctomycetaceae bacterium]|nr:nucleoside-diphosphate sugar epimerase [Blastopirellula sp.]HAY82762.1 nucleoside-diphosphate sugar epimerase [Planctomycetaceae bacterium]